MWLLGRVSSRWKWLFAIARRRRLNTRGTVANCREWCHICVGLTLLLISFCKFVMCRNVDRTLSMTHTAYEISALSAGEISPIVLVYLWVWFISRRIFIKSLFVDVLVLSQGVTLAAGNDMVAVSRWEEFWLHGLFFGIMFWGGGWRLCTVRSKKIKDSCSAAKIELQVLISRWDRSRLWCEQ